MLNSEIKYPLSTDYERLQELLKAGIKVVGFGAFKSSLIHSRLTFIWYDTHTQQYNFDRLFSFWEDQLTEPDSFARICELKNIRFIDIDFGNNEVNWNEFKD